jgi:hypothetical protein
MSYILDALNKAERERVDRRPSAPPICHDPQVHGRRGFWIIAGVLLASISAAVWLSWPSATPLRPAPDRARTQSQESLAAYPSPTQAVSVPAPAKKQPALSVSEPSAPTKAPRQTSTADSSGTTRQPLPPRPPASAAQQGPPAETQAATAAAVSPLPPRATPDARGETVAVFASPAVQGGATSIREAIGKMTLTVLMYDEAKSERRVYINGRKYIEGDYVDGRYLVESITLEGVLLSCDGERALLRSGAK